VHETSIYRRWGSPSPLILEACLHFTEDAIPIPDTGTLRSDLVALMGRAVAILGTPQGQAILALIQLRGENSLRARQEYWQRRFVRLQPIFDRAISRGEFSRHADPIVLLQTLIAPLYFRFLVTVEELVNWPVAELVDRLPSGYANSSRQISDHCHGVAESTIKTHLGRLFAKTGAGRQADPVKIVAGFVTPPIG
jgi:hypothetical protein